MSDGRRHALPQRSTGLRLSLSSCVKAQTDSCVAAVHAQQRGRLTVRMSSLSAGSGACELCFQGKVFDVVANHIREHGVDSVIKKLLLAVCVLSSACVAGILLQLPYKHRQRLQPDLN
jgi:hypothetical protein